MKHRNQKKKYFSLASAGRTADIFIFGDITSWEWLESDVSSYTLARAVQDLDADQINVHINSYGGEVAEGLAIYNSLKNHPARVRTVCDGFACSAASVVFMAGDVRVMNPASLLMVHNAWTNASGNARELRKAADDLDVITSASVETYKARVNLSDGELAALLEIYGEENRIAVERRKFNDVARNYNSYIRQFPRNILAGMFGFTPKPYFEANAGAENAPKVEF